MRCNPEYRKFRKHISTFGLTLEMGGRHYAIRNKDGKRVGTLAISPRGPYKFAIKNTLKQLRDNGVLDNE